MSFIICIFADEGAEGVAGSGAGIHIFAAAYGRVGPWQKPTQDHNRNLCCSTRSGDVRFSANSHGN